MNRIVTFIQRSFPSRRRRQWRYVSGRRRRVSITLFALIMLAIYGWWYFTNDDRIKRQAEEFLCSFTGAEVRIQRAEFSIFEGIRLSGVRVRVRDSGRVGDMFEAREVWLKHSPLTLVSQGRLEVTEVICIKPILSFTQDTDRTSANRLFQPRGEHRGRMFGPLPVIRLRESEVHRIDVVKGQELPAAATPPMNVSLTPQAGQPIYNVVAEELNPAGPAQIKAQGYINVQTGEHRLTWSIPIQGLDRAMPRKYSQWYDLYKLKGDPNALGVTLDRGPRGRERLIVQLNKVSMELPPQQGGLMLSNLTGQLVLTEEGLEIQDLSGQVAQAGGATVQLTGRVDGYSADSPFELTLNCGDLRLPITGMRPSRLAEIVDGMQRELEPRGLVAVAVTIKRDAAGQLTLQGSAQPKGLSVADRNFPYRMDEMEGLVEFDMNHISIKKITGRHNQALMDVAGEITDVTGQYGVDLRLHASELALEPELRGALSKSVHRTWDGFSPNGTCEINVHIYKPAGQDASLRTTLDIRFDGKASLAYRGFPIDKVRGLIVVGESDVTVQGLQGLRGDARVDVTGVVAGMYRPVPEVDIEVRAVDMELDKYVAAPLEGAGRATYDSFHLGGKCDFVGRFHFTEAKGLDYSISATLKGVSLNFDGFPYPMTGATGVVRVSPSRTEVENLAGQCGQGRLSVSGAVLQDRHPVGLDLRFLGTDILLDRTLYAALPADVKAVWDRLGPDGLTDIDFTLRTQGGAIPQPADYKLILNAKNIGVTYRGFPYTVRGLSGQAIAQPGRVDLVNFATGGGEPPLRLSGQVVTSGPASGQANLSLWAQGMPIDERLLQSMPKELRAISRNIKPGGQADVDLRMLSYSWGPGGGAETITPATTQPTKVPATRLVSAPAEPGRWNIVGSLGVRGAMLDAALGARQLSGSIVGSAACDDNADHAAIDARLRLDSVVLGDRQLTNAVGTIRKPADEAMMRITELSGHAYGGQLAGFAEVSFTPQARYGLSLSVEKVQLDEVLNAGLADPTQRVKGAGELRGTLQLLGTVGDHAARRAVGELRFDKAELYRMPVLVSLLSVANLQLPGDTAFRSGQVTYVLKGDTLTLQEIHMVSPSLSLLGNGTVDVASERMRLVFLAGPPQKVPPLIRVLNELVRTTTQGLLEFHVSGTLRKPIIETVPLRNVDQFLKELVTAPEGS